MKCLSCGRELKRHSSKGIKKDGVLKEDIGDALNGKGGYYNCAKCDWTAFLVVNENIYKWNGQKQMWIHRAVIPEFVMFT